MVDSFLVSLILAFLLTLIVLLGVNVIFTDHFIHKNANGLLKLKHHNKLFISKCKGNQTGQQAGESNSTSNYAASCIAPIKSKT